MPTHALVIAIYHHSDLNKSFGEKAVLLFPDRDAAQTAAIKILKDHDEIHDGLEGAAAIEAFNDFQMSLQTEEYFHVFPVMPADEFV